MTDKGKESGLTLWRIRFGQVFKFMARFIHYGFVPLTIYLGLSLGQTEPNSPPLNLRSLIWQ